MIDGPRKCRVIAIEQWSAQDRELPVKLRVTLEANYEAARMWQAYCSSGALGSFTARDPADMLGSTGAMLPQALRAAGSVLIGNDAPKDAVREQAVDLLLDQAASEGRMALLTRECLARGWGGKGTLRDWLQINATPSLVDAVFGGAPPLTMTGLSQQKKRPVRFASERVAASFDVESFIAEVAQAAGLPKDIAYGNLLTALQKLHAAALPPYEPQSPPAVARCGGCGEPTIVRLNRRTQKEFTGCSAWPACDWVYVPPKPKGTDVPGYVRRKVEIE